MTIMSFVFPIIHDDVTVAEIEGSVDVQPLSRRNKAAAADDFKKGAGQADVHLIATIAD